LTDQFEYFPICINAARKSPSPHGVPVRFLKATYRALPLKKPTVISNPSLMSPVRNPNASSPLAHHAQKIRRHRRLLSEVRFDLFFCLQENVHPVKAVPGTN
jgi:hypothetical protein